LADSLSVSPTRTLVTPYCKRTRPGRRTTRRPRVSPLLSFPPFVFRLALTHLGWDTRRQFTRRSRDPPGSKRRQWWTTLMDDVDVGKPRLPWTAVGDGVGRRRWVAVVGRQGGGGGRGRGAQRGSDVVGAGAAGSTAARGAGAPVACGRARGGGQPRRAGAAGSTGGVRAGAPAACGLAWGAGSTAARA
jgi:hypothetical protein